MERAFASPSPRSSAIGRLIRERYVHKMSRLLQNSFYWFTGYIVKKMFIYYRELHLTDKLFTS